VAIARIGERHPSPSRKETHARTCEAILRAAQQILAAEGMTHLSMRSLGRAVGLNAASLYGYFRSKDDVISALFDQKLAEIARALEAGGDTPGEGLARVETLSVAFRRFALQNPDYGEMFQAVMDGSFERARHWRERVLDAVLEYRAGIDEAIRAGELPAHVNPEQAVMYLWIAMHGYIDLEGRNCIGKGPDHPAESEAEFVAYLRLLIAGLAA